MPEVERILMGQLAMNYDSARNLVADAKVTMKQKGSDPSDEKKLAREARKLYEERMAASKLDTDESANTTADITADDIPTPVKPSQVTQKPVVTPSPVEAEETEIKEEVKEIVEEQIVQDKAEEAEPKEEESAPELKEAEASTPAAEDEDVTESSDAVERGRSPKSKKKGGLLRKLKKSLSRKKVTDQ